MSSSKSLKRRPKSKNVPAGAIRQAERTPKGEGPADILRMPGFFQPDAETLRYWRARSELITRGAVKGARGRAA